jgi:hypothetical protein
MHLVQFLLPVRSGDGSAVPDEAFRGVREELTARYGGVTAYLRAPASGAWVEHDGQVARDDMVMVEVMVDSLDRAWWADYRRSLEARFGQETVLVRATACEVL